MDLTIPQENMRREARGYVNPELWDRGIDAGFIGYAIPGIIRQAGEYAAGKETTEHEALDALMAFLAAGLGLTKNEET